jgi:hypothetical protein
MIFPGSLFLFCGLLPTAALCTDLCDDAKR